MIHCYSSVQHSKSHLLVRLEQIRCRTHILLPVDELPCETKHTGLLCDGYVIE